MRALKAIFNTSAFTQNLKIVRDLAPESKIMAVLKANAYGHGLIDAARALSSAEGFSVLSLSEAIDLREHGFDQYILLLEGFFSAYEVKVCSQMNISAVIHDNRQIDFINQTKPKNPINIHLKVNTGMNRLGFSVNGLEKLLVSLEASPYIGNIILMTHFANADGPIGINEQLILFNNIIYPGIGDHRYHLYLLSIPTRNLNCYVYRHLITTKPFDFGGFIIMVLIKTPEINSLRKQRRR